MNILNVCSNSIEGEKEAYSILENKYNYERKQYDILYR
jgi:hypothetical protein